jgi:putative phosphoesterase
VETLRLLVVSDIHSNLTALEKVLEDAGGFDELICAGDIVGYGPDPSICIETVKKLGTMCVSGNHDFAASTGDSSNLNAYAAEAIAINRRLMNPGQAAWLGGLPRRLTLDREGIAVAAVHGSPSCPLMEYVYPSEARMRAEEFFEATGAGLLIMGHTHVPFIHRSGARVLLNPGSVGQPRDGDPRASYMLVDLDDGGMEVKHRRVEYDIEVVATRIRRLGIPEMLAARLFQGW